MENIENTQNEPKKEKSSKAGVIILIILLLASWGIIGYLYFDTTQTIEQQQIVIQEKEDERVELIAQLDSIQNNLEALRSQNDTINAELEAKIAEVKNLKNQVWSVKNANKKEIENLKEQIATMQTVAQEYIQKIALLDQENKILRDSTKMLIEDINEAKQIDEEKTKQIEELSEKVDKASVLKAQAVVAVPLDKKSKPNFKVKKVTKIKVAGILMENPIIEPGDKTIYVRITRNDGVVMTADQNNTFTYDEEVILFTEKRDVNYNNANTEFEIYYTTDSNLTAGNYKVDLFSDGKEIGNTTFLLK